MPLLLLTGRGSYVRRALFSGVKRHIRLLINDFGIGFLRVDIARRHNHLARPDRRVLDEGESGNLGHLDQLAVLAEHHGVDAGGAAAQVGEVPAVRHRRAQHVLDEVRHGRRRRSPARQVGGVAHVRAQFLADVFLKFVDRRLRQR